MDTRLKEGTTTVTTTTTNVTNPIDRCCDVVFTEDLVFEILLRLPVISLLRFKSVCKSWCTLIESSSFTHQHHRHRCSNLDERTFGKLIAGDKVKGAHITDCPPIRVSLLSGGDEVPTKLTLNYFLESSGHVHIGMVTCNGIICLHTRGDYTFTETLNVSLWNPATKQLRHLPRTTPTPYDNNCAISLGFGVDVKSNTYKVVRILHPDSYLSKRILTCFLDVYNLTTDSWRSIDTVLPVHRISSNPGVPFRNGSYLWLGMDTNPQPGKRRSVTGYIISFDFTKEEFGSRIPLPDVSVNHDKDLGLAIVRDSIACISKQEVADESNNSGYFEIYVLFTDHDLVQEGKAVSSSWSKLYKVGPFLMATQMGLSENGNFLFLSIDYQLCVYDIKRKELQSLPHSFHRRLGMETVIIYKESMISVEKGISSLQCMKRLV